MKSNVTSPCPQLTTSLLIRPSSTSFARKLSAFADSALPKSVTEPPAEYNQGINWKVPSSFPIAHMENPYTESSGFVVALHIS